MKTNKQQTKFESTPETNEDEEENTSNQQTPLAVLASIGGLALVIVGAIILNPSMILVGSVIALPSLITVYSTMRSYFSSKKTKG